MKTADPVPVVLTVHETQAGQYVIRLGDLKWKRLMIEVAKLLSDAESLVMITPDDVKVLKLKAETQGDETAETVEETSEETPEETAETTEAAQAMAEQETHAVPNQENGNGNAATRRRKPREPIAGHDETCMRCNGLGQVQVMMPDGNAAETACPICKGERVMRRYGARR